jgi:hypothetical protein
MTLVRVALVLCAPMVTSVCFGAADSFAATVRPVLEKYCFECHGVKATKADVDLASFKTEDDLAKNQNLWLTVLEQMRSHSMPPAKAAQPAEVERQLVADWIDASMDRLDERAPPIAARLPLHRLNRVEYNNTVRDLIGLDLRPADDFPADDTAHGFDNVAEVLTLPPLLLEKYFEAAVKVIDNSIITEGSGDVIERMMEAESFAKAQNTNGAAQLNLEQETGASIDVPRTGDYEVRVRAWQSGATNDPATLVLKVDGVDTKLWQLSRGGELMALSAILPLANGARRIALRHTSHMELPKGAKGSSAVRLFIDSIEVRGPTKALAHRRIFFVQPGADVSDRDAAKQIIQRFATRAFRRPVEDAELERFLALYTDGRKSRKSHVEAARLSLAAVLVSPQFIFRIERDASVKDEFGAIRLNDHELANRLSYFLWSSMPDDELFRLAAARKLSDLAVLRAQVKRMLANPKAEAFTENFAGQWLHVRKLDSVAPDAEMFRAFTPGLREAMKAEALKFFETVMLEDRSVLEFLNSDWTMLNEDLAKHYGIRNILGGHMRRVELTNSVRGGVTTMAAVLTVTSHPTRTSAVKRGKWVLEEILGARPPPPPPNVPELEEPAKGQPVATTLRERLERHRADPQCFGCHVRMDALGLGFENFDAIGRWRDKEGQHRIDASGILPGGYAFASPMELKQILAGEKEAFTRNLVEKMLVYALGRKVDRHDRREVKRICTALAQNDYRFSTLVTEIAASYPFRHRTTVERNDTALRP